MLLIDYIQICAGTLITCYEECWDDEGNNLQSGSITLCAPTSMPTSNTRISDGNKHFNKLFIIPIVVSVVLLILLVVCIYRYLKRWLRIRRLVNLPVHKAILTGSTSEHIIDLANLFPETLAIKDAYNMNAFELAMECGIERAVIIHLAKVM
jgi:hypothetical protein